MTITLLLIIAIYVAYELTTRTPTTGPSPAEHTTLNPDEITTLDDIEAHLAATDPQLARKLRR